MALTTQQHQKLEAERQQKEKEENEKRLQEILPKFDADLKALQVKYGIRLEGFLVYNDLGIQPGVRIRITPKDQNPYNVP